jgi:hypothetical protein
MALSVEQEEWEARTTLDIGLLITRYMRDNPPPEQSNFVLRLVGIAAGLEDAGRQEVHQAGIPSLRVAAAVNPTWNI